MIQMDGQVDEPDQEPVGEAPPPALDDHDIEPPMDVQRKHFNKDKAELLSKQIKETVHELLDDYRKEIFSLESSNQTYYKENERLKRELADMKSKLKELAA